MKHLKKMAFVMACCVFVGALLSGCGSNDVKQAPGSGGKNMTDKEKKEKRGE